MMEPYLLVDGLLRPGLSGAMPCKRRQRHPCTLLSPRPDSRQDAHDPRWSSQHAIGPLFSLMDDCASLQETLLQWMSPSPTAREIDRELGDLRHDLVVGAPILSYLRYNVDLRKASGERLDSRLTDPKLIESLSEMDAPENMPLLHRLGALAAERDVKGGDFPSLFDLPAD